MIDVYRIEKDRMDTLNNIAEGNIPADDIVHHYIRASVESEEYKKQVDALTDSMLNHLPKEQVETIFNEAQNIITEFDWRYTREEDKELLKEYHCDLPLVPVKDLEKALDCLEEGYPVLLLSRDGDRKQAELGVDIEMHLKAGGICAISQFAAEMEDMRSLDRAISGYDNEV